MPTTASPLNGVDTDKLRTTIRTLEQHPELGVFRFGVARRWPDELADGGPSTVSNPTELLLHALAACLTDAVLQVAATQGVEIHDVDCRIEGSMDVRGTLGITTAVRNGFTAIRIALGGRGRRRPRGPVRDRARREGALGGLRHGHQRRPDPARRPELTHGAVGVIRITPYREAVATARTSG